MKYLFLIILSILLTNCKDNSHDPSLSKKPVDISINLKHGDRNYILSFGQLFSNEKILKLTLKDSGKIAAISKVIVYKSKYFVLDKKFSQLFSFDESGKQIARFGNVGLNPGEFRKISDFDITSNQLAILSNDDQIINYYDVNTGRFIRRQYIQLYGYSLACLPKNNTLIFVNQNNNDKSKEHDVVTIDSSNNIMERFFPIDLKKNYITLTFTGFLNKSNDEIFYCPPFDDIVYRYSNGEFQRYIDFGINSSKVKANVKNIDKIFKETIIRDPETSFLEELFLKNDRYIINTFQDSMHSNFCFYNIKQQKINVINKNLVHDPNILLMNDPLFLNNKDEIICDVSPETVYYLKTSLPEVYNNLNSENQMILNKITKTSNPLLMICKLK